MNVLFKKHENNYIQQLLFYIPDIYLKNTTHSNPYEQIINAVTRLCHATKIE